MLYGNILEPRASTVESAMKFSIVSTEFGFSSSQKFSFVPRVDTSWQIRILTQSLENSCAVGQSWSSVYPVAELMSFNGAQFFTTWPENGAHVQLWPFVCLPKWAWSFDVSTFFSLVPDDEKQKGVVKEKTNQSQLRFFAAKIAFGSFVTSWSNNRSDRSKLHIGWTIWTAHHGFITPTRTP